MKILKQTRGFLLAIAALVACSATCAADGEGDLNLAQERLERMFEQLGLTEEQEAAMKPVIEESAAKRRAIYEEHGIDRGMTERPSLREMRALRKDLLAARKESDAKFAAILTDEQMRALEDSRKAARKELRERFAVRRNRS